MGFAESPEESRWPSGEQQGPKARGTRRLEKKPAEEWSLNQLHATPRQWTAAESSTA